MTNAGGAGGRSAAFVAESAGIMTFSPIVAGQSAFFQNTFSGNADDGPCSPQTASARTSS